MVDISFRFLTSIVTQLLSVIIPCYNEAPTLQRVVEEVLSVGISLEREVIIIDDGSHDGSYEIAKELASKYQEVKVLRNKQRRGKGYCIRRALEVAKGDIVLIQDADGEFKPREYPKLLKPILEGKTTDVVYGSRNLQPNPITSKLCYYGGKINTWLFNLLFGTKLTDLNTGFKVFRRDVLLNIKLLEDGFNFCEEVTAKLAKRGVRIVEVPIDYEPRRKGKKLKWWKHAVGSLRVMLRERFLTY